jgi:hypothetical protein
MTKQMLIYSIILGKKSAESWLDTYGSDVNIEEALETDFIPEYELTGDFGHEGKGTDTEIKYFKMGWKLGLKSIYNMMKKIEDDDPWFEDPYSGELLSTNQAIKKYHG